MTALIRSYSLTQRLSLILLLITTSVWLGSLGTIYWGMQRTANSIFDKSLAETAHALLSTTLSTLDGQVPERTAIEKIQGEHFDQIVFQIWHRDGQLIYRSVGVDTQPFVHQAELGWIKIGDQTYRSYAVWDSTHTIQVQIAQIWNIRQDIQKDMLLFLILISAIFLPLLSWLIVRIIRSQLSAVYHISQNLEKQSIEHLHPIHPVVPKEIKPLVNSLNTLLSEITESMQREKRFTSNAAHELRTPLAAIRLHAQVLQSARSAEEAREAADDIIVGVDKASRMIAQLLTLARLEPHALDASALEQQRSGHAPVKLNSEMDLAESIRSSLNMMDFQMRQAGIALHLKLDTAPVLAQPDQIEIMLRNLLENAMIYRHPERSPVIQISSGVTASHSFIQIEDNGIGIDEERIALVFQRFFRVNQSSQVVGSGLGLSIVKQILDLHHGSIVMEAASAEGGLRVRIELDCHYPHGSAISEVAS